MTVDTLRAALEAKGYAFFTEGDYNLNLIGVRSTRCTAGLFDDALYCCYRVHGHWRVHRWAITTDPGRHYLEKPINPAGCAILVPGQYRGAYQVGRHRGAPALVQRGPVRVWRDGNRNDVLDWGSDAGIEGYYGINIHRAKGTVASSSDTASAGCQVFAVAAEHQALMDLAGVAAGRWGNGFSYTLLEEGDLGG